MRVWGTGEEKAVRATVSQMIDRHWQSVVRGSYSKQLLLSCDGLIL